MRDAKILFVDDEVNVLSSYKRTLRNRFNVSTASSAKEALELIVQSAKTPFAVIVSDFKMPEMTGLEFLKRASEIAPATVRVMLTGYSDIDTAISAINEGHIFRFLTKPSPPAMLTDSLTTCVKQFQLVQAEKELLRGTLQGSIKLMTELLALTNPVAFGQSERIKRLVSLLLKEYEVSMSWIVEVAAMLSQIGCTSLPTELVSKVNRGDELTAEEAELYRTHPESGSQLLKNIPRLDKVADIIAYQDDIGHSNAPVGAKIVNIVKRYDFASCNGTSVQELIGELRKEEYLYGPSLVDALEKIASKEVANRTEQLSIASLKRGMIVDQNVVTNDNLLLINKGQELTDVSIMRLSNYGKSCGVKEPIQVIIQQYQH